MYSLPNIKKGIQYPWTLKKTKNNYVLIFSHPPINNKCLFPTHMRWLASALIMMDINVAVRKLSEVEKTKTSQQYWIWDTLQQSIRDVAFTPR